jgi:hypothetical protein
MAKWQKETLKLTPDHSWRAKPGYQILVLDRGTIRFDIPEGWVVAPGEGALEARNRPYPDDTCLIQVTLLPFFAGPEADTLPLAQMLAEASGHSGDDTAVLGPVKQVIRPGVELVWRETRYLDPGEQREACSRTCLARGAGRFVLFTMSFWPADSARWIPVWNELLRSLRMGEYVEPTTGRPAP